MAWPGAAAAVERVLATGGRADEPDRSRTGCSPSASTTRARRSAFGSRPTGPSARTRRRPSAQPGQCARQEAAHCPRTRSPHAGTCPAGWPRDDRLVELVTPLALCILDTTPSWARLRGISCWEDGGAVRSWSRTNAVGTAKQNHVPGAGDHSVAQAVPGVLARMTGWGGKPSRFPGIGQVHQMTRRADPASAAGTPGCFSAASATRPAAIWDVGRG
jgi:hypothetical protein